MAPSLSQGSVLHPLHVKKGEVSQVKSSQVKSRAAGPWQDTTSRRKSTSEKALSPSVPPELHSQSLALWVGFQMIGFDNGEEAEPKAPKAPLVGALCVVLCS